MSKLLFHEASPLPYAVITLTANASKPERSSNMVASQVAKTQREIALRREAELQKVVTCRSNFKPTNKLLPSITIKRSHPEKPIVLLQ
jgi:phosphoribosylaminoimidazole carboxylase (NCAIR synthetase)